MWGFGGHSSKFEGAKNADDPPQGWGGPISGPDERKEVLSLRFRFSQRVFGQFPGSYHGDHSEKGGNH